MSPKYQTKSEVMGLVSSAVFSLIVYYVLTYLFVSQGVTIPLSILTFTLIYGLTRYYSLSHGQKDTKTSRSGDKGEQIKSNSKIYQSESDSNLLFLGIFVTLVIICALFSNENFMTFVPWDKFNGIGLIHLGAAIALAFFIPGYAIILILTKKRKIDPILKILLGYVLSILISGLSVFISAYYLDSGASQYRIILLSLYAVIVTVFIIHHHSYSVILNIIRDKKFRFISVIGNRLASAMLEKGPELLVFGSLLGFLIVATYNVYGGITIGDQWFHQGRALLFLSGNFKEVTLFGEDSTYPPLHSAVIAGLTAISGTSVVNAYAAMALVNLTAVFAFYYFCRTWFPANNERAALIAATLFFLGSGFGWIYVLYLANLDPIISPASSLATLTEDRIDVSDITLSSNFMISAFPDFSTPLIYVSLTAGFLLLGLVRSKLDNEYVYTIILTALATTGLLFHPEFYLFIVVSSILPLVLNLKNRNSMYLAFLVSFASVFILNVSLPIKYFTINEILGIPLIGLNIIIVALMWGLYTTRQYLHPDILSKPIPLIKRIKSSIYRTNRISLISRTGLIWAAIYLWALSFIVWTSLPIIYLQSQTSDFTTPWYLYPLRLGIIGVFGLAYLLSYLFKRFEKEIFIFGIIALLAFVAGPYYNEHRFSKYIMVGFIGFASLLIFKLFIFVANKKPIILGAVIGSIVITGSLSTFMFIAYTAVEMENQLYTQGLALRDFPSAQQMRMLQLIQSKLHVGTNMYNIGGFPFEYYSHGIINKIHAFTGFPIGRIEQSPLSLNSTTLELFYNLLESSNIKYIIISKNTVDENKIPDPIRFALNNFHHIYEDDDYLILQIPSLRGPTIADSADSEVPIAFVKETSPITDYVANLKLNNTNIYLENSTLKPINLQSHNQSTTTTLGYSENMTFKNESSKNLNLNKTDSVNYFQAMFKILSQKIGNDRLGWIEGNTTYSLGFTKTGLELTQGGLGTNKTLLLYQNAEQYRNDGLWHLLRVASLNDSIDVYINDERKIHVLKPVREQISQISNISISGNNKFVEFSRIQAGKIPSSSQLYDKKNYYDYYYPLSLVALSRTKYSSFSEDDNAVFGQRKIILPFDPMDWTDSKFKSYVDYASSGGILVVMNSNIDFDGRFSKLLSIVPTSNGTTEFTNLSGKNGMQLLDISGTVRPSESKISNDTRVLASYRNNESKILAPFVVEKRFPSGGKIILVNDKGYFDATYAYPIKYFPSLQNITNLFDIKPDNTFVAQDKIESVKRFIGAMNIKGNTTIASSSFSLVDGSQNSPILKSRAISILYEDKKMNKYFKNVPIANIKLNGKYKVSIDSIGRTKLPLENSRLDYIEVQLPSGFNMTIRLLNNKSSAEIITRTNTSLDSIKVNNESSIKISKMRPLVGLPNSINIMLKSPEMLINGNTRFDGANFEGELPTTNPPLDVIGQVKTRLNFVDNYKVKAGASGIRGQYITYLGSVTIDGKTQGEKNNIIPGDITDSAKKQGLTIPLYQILNSPINILILIVSTIISIAASLLLSRRHFAIT